MKISVETDQQRKKKRENIKVEGGAGSVKEGGDKQTFLTWKEIELPFSVRGIYGPMNVLSGEDPSPELWTKKEAGQLHINKSLGARLCVWLESYRSLEKMLLQTKCWPLKITYK